MSTFHRDCLGDGITSALDPAPVVGGSSPAAALPRPEGRHAVALDLTGDEPRFQRLPRPAYVRVVKPIADRVLALVILLLVLPVLVVVAIAIRVQLGPGVLYRQRRVGLGGAPFTIYKFRTMLADRRARDERAPGPERRRTHKTDHDPRHTPLGRFLRQWSLDELPQLWNVLCGDMSIIGPRPELTHVVAEYEPWQHRRHDVRPGLTGLWQVTRRADGELMRYHTDTDIDYVEQVSFALDLRILILTIPALLGRQGR